MMPDELKPCPNEKGRWGKMKEKLIELLIKTFDEQYEKKMLITPQHTAEFLIANGVTVQNQWISVEDKLPNKQGKYLCLWSYRSEDIEPSIDVLNFDGKCFPWEHTRKDVYVSHWQQLPELPIT